MEENIQQNQEVIDAREKITSTLMDALSQFPNSPSEETISKWKEEYEIMLTGLDEDELYIWRPITRLEFRQLKQSVFEKAQEAAQSNPPQAFDADGIFAEAIVDMCILWASKPNALSKKAGTYDFLHEQIMLNSNFVNPSMAASLVVKL